MKFDLGEGVRTVSIDWVFSDCRAYCGVHAAFGSNELHLASPREFLPKTLHMSSFKLLLSFHALAFGK